MWLSSHWSQAQGSAVHIQGGNLLLDGAAALHSYSAITYAVAYFDAAATGIMYSWKEKI